MRFSYLFTFLVVATVLQAQIGPINPAKVDSINQSARSDSLSLMDRIRIGEQGIELSETIDYPKGKFDGLMTIGIGYLNLGNYKEALDHFQQANQLAVSLKNAEFKARTTYYMGLIHDYLGNFEKGLSYFDESLRLYESLGNTRWQGILSNGIGVALSKVGREVEGLEILKEALEIFESNGMERESSVPLNNIGEYYLHDNKPEQALSYYQQSLQLSQKYNIPRGEAIALTNVGLSYRALKDYNAALNYMMQGLELAQNYEYNVEVYEIYREMAQTYEAMNLPEKAIAYYKKHTELKDSILSNEHEAQIAELLVEFETEKKETELAASQQQILELEQKQRFQRLLTAVIVAGLILAVILIFLLISRHRVQQKLSESELRNKKLESQKLKEELEFKNKDLTNFALDIARKNEFSQKIHNGLHLIHQSSDPNFRKDKIKELLILTASHLKVNDDIREFQMNVEKVNQDFFHQLSERFPELTNTEKQLCGLLRLNLSTKDIANIRNISPKSVEMGRYRLRKKLNLEANEDINAFLQQL